MAIFIFERVCNQARSDFDEVAAQLAFLAATGKLIAASGAVAGLVAADANVRPIVDGFRKNGIDDFNTLYQGLFVQVCSAYEAFVTDLISDFVKETAAKYKTYDALKARGVLLDRHIYHTGMALQQVFDNRTNRVLDFDLLAKNLASVVPGNAAVTLNVDVFTLLLGALKPDGLQQAFKRIGYEEDRFWDAVGGRDGLKKIFNEKGARATATATKQYLVKFISRRNAIVHRGKNVEAVSEAEVLYAIDFFKVFTLALGEILAAHI